jgi:hypothetical protein
MSALQSRHRKTHWCPCNPDTGFEGTATSGEIEARARRGILWSCNELRRALSFLRSFAPIHEELWCMKRGRALLKSISS